jgi:hypothetical protein
LSASDFTYWHTLVRHIGNDGKERIQLVLHFTQTRSELLELVTEVCDFRHDRRNILVSPWPAGSAGRAVALGLQLLRACSMVLRSASSCLNFAASSM